MCREEWEDLPMASFLSLKSYFLREDFLDQFYHFFLITYPIMLCLFFSRPSHSLYFTDLGLLTVLLQCNVNSYPSYSLMCVLYLDQYLVRISYLLSTE